MPYVEDVRAISAYEVAVVGVPIRHENYLS